LRRLHAALTDAEDRRRIREDLERRLPAVRALEWWSVGQAVLADFVKEEDAPDALVRARSLAQAGAAAYPDSIGGPQCRAIVAENEAPSYQPTAMVPDGPRHPSTHAPHAYLAPLPSPAYP